MLAPAVAPMPPDLQAEMLAAYPRLRAMGIALCGDLNTAEDLVQDAMLSAIINIHTFTPGTTLVAWLYAIMRNKHYSNWRKRKREVAVVDDRFSDSLRFSAGGEHDEMCRLDCAKLQALLLLLPAAQREALDLVADGHDYESAAAVLGCAVGTVKSRVNRGREALTGMLNGYVVEWQRDGGEERAAWARLEQAGALDDFAREEY
jgi:RNA polymerase sigma-70 factor, ECF subfamily